MTKTLRKPTAAKRRAARQKIVSVANSERMALGLEPTLTMRHIQRAVCIVRRRRPGRYAMVLVDAGFNASGKAARS